MAVAFIFCVIGKLATFGIRLHVRNFLWQAIKLYIRLRLQNLVK